MEVMQGLLALALAVLVTVTLANILGVWDVEDAE